MAHMTDTVTFKVGDIVRDTVRAQVGTVWGGNTNVLELQDSAGYTWRALAHRCQLIRHAQDPEHKFPPGTTPVTCTPLDVKVGDWVRLQDGRAYEIGDMRSHGPGGRILHLKGWPHPWVMPSGARQVYRPLA